MIDCDSGTQHEHLTVRVATMNHINKMIVFAGFACAVFSVSRWSYASWTGCGTNQITSSYVGVVGGDIPTCNGWQSFSSPTTGVPPYGSDLCGGHWIVDRP